MTKFNKTLLASLAAFAAAGANSAAFQLAEISTSGLGMAYAGNAAVADNASVVATNPALMTKFKQTEISAGGVLVDANVNITGTLGNQAANHKNAVPSAVVPNAYIVAPITDKFALGGGMNVNYGLKSEYPVDYNAGMYGGTTELTAINLNLSGAYDFGYGFSAGAGLNAIYSKAELTRHLGLGNQLLAARLNAAAQAPAYSAYASVLQGAAQGIAAMPNSTEISSIKGDEWSFGWNVGVSYDFNENHRIGLAYHSPVDVKFKGQYSNGFDTSYNQLLQLLSSAGMSLPLSVATGGEQVAGRLTLNLPAYWELSGWHKLTERLAMQYSWKYTQWTRLKTLTAYGTDGTQLFSKDEYFSNSSRYAIGFSYDVNDELTVRTGFAYDQNASKNHPSISIPDTSRTWYSLGGTYRFTPNLSADVGYTYIKGRKREFTEGSAIFKARSDAHLYGLNVNYKF